MKMLKAIKKVVNAKLYQVNHEKKQFHSQKITREEYLKGRRGSRINVIGHNQIATEPSAADPD